MMLLYKPNISSCFDRSKCGCKTSRGHVATPALRRFMNHFLQRRLHGRGKFRRSCFLPVVKFRCQKLVSSLLVPCPQYLSEIARQRGEYDALGVVKQTSKLRNWSRIFLLSRINLKSSHYAVILTHIFYIFRHNKKETNVTLVLWRSLKSTSATLSET